jgi:hypothetical protein
MRYSSKNINLARLIADELKPLTARWLKLKEAAIYSGIGRNRLKSLACAGAIKGFPDPDSGRRDWVFDKLSLDAYRQAQANELEQKAFSIMNKK